MLYVLFLNFKLRCICIHIHKCFNLFRTSSPKSSHKGFLWLSFHLQNKHLEVAFNLMIFKTFLLWNLHTFFMTEQKLFKLQMFKVTKMVLQKATGFMRERFCCCTEFTKLLIADSKETVTSPMLFLLCSYHSPMLKATVSHVLM